MSNNYQVKNIENNSENIDKKIRSNVIFSIASFLLAGVAFGVGDEILGNTSLQYITAFSALGISTASIRSLKENLKLKSGQNNKTKGK